MSIVSMLQIVEPHHAIGWTGRSMGTRAIHTCKIEERDGLVLVISEESMTGWLVRLFSGSIRKIVERSLATWSERLKTAAENR